jgi:hypothetical protein
MADLWGATPRRPSSAIPWKTNAAPVAGSFENPLYATISDAAPANRRVNGTKRSSTRHSSDKPLFDGQPPAQRPRSSGSVIRFASEHGGERRTASIEAFKPGTCEVDRHNVSLSQGMTSFSMP